MEAVEYIEYDFPAEFNSTNIYRGPPTPEREEAWFNLTFSELPNTNLVILPKAFLPGNRTCYRDSE